MGCYFSMYTKFYLKSLLMIGFGITAVTVTNGLFSACVF
jgi:hypothetical protein